MSRAGGWWKSTAILLTAILSDTSEGTRGSEGPQEPDRPKGRKLSHEETLRWIQEHKAWRLASKTKPIYARPVQAEEIGKEFLTAEHVKEVARAGAWLCVGVAGEPWFQTREKIEAKYEPSGEKTTKFNYDKEPRRYSIYRPKAVPRTWVAQVKGPGIEGFFIRPGYDPDYPLYSPAGGYVARDEVDDPYKAAPNDVWLVQQPLFKSTFELLSDEGSSSGTEASR
jgi:hypothetical protein